jgi:hypothetical protein
MVSCWASTRFFDKAEQRGLRAVPRVWVILAAMLVTGCQPNRTDTLASCQLDADRFYHMEPAAIVEGPRTRYVVGCMAAHGYKFDFLQTHCESSRPFAMQPACYSALKLSWFGLIVSNWR